MNPKPLKPTDKRFVTDLVGNYPQTYELDYRTVDKVIIDMQEFKKNYPDCLNMRFAHGCCHKYDATEYYYLVCDRLETDEELAKRLDEALQQEKREKEQLAYLKKKYDTTS